MTSNFFCPPPCDSQTVCVAYNICGSGSPPNISNDSLQTFTRRLARRNVDIQAANLPSFHLQCFASELGECIISSLLFHNFVSAQYRTQVQIVVDLYLVLVSLYPGWIISLLLQCYAVTYLQFASASKENRYLPMSHDLRVCSLFVHHIFKNRKHSVCTLSFQFMSVFRRRHLWGIFYSRQNESH